MPDVVAALRRFSGRLGLMALCVAAWGFWSGAVWAASSEPAAAVAARPGVTLRDCGAVAPESVAGASLLPARLARPGDRLVPGDRGLGCRFTVEDVPQGRAVPVEVRLLRPGPAGNAVADRWFVVARGGVENLAAHCFDAPIAAGAGPWTLEVYRDGRLAGQRRFTVAETAMPANPTEATAEAASSVPAEPPVAEGPAEPGQATSAATPSTPPAPRPKAAPAATEPASKKPSAKPADKKAAAPAPGYYAWQTGLFADADNAAKQAARLRRRGFPACLATEKTDKGRRYRVLAGRYGDRTVALARRRDVARAAGSGTVLYRVEPAVIGRLRCH